MTFAHMSEMTSPSQRVFHRSQNTFNRIQNSFVTIEIHEQGENKTFRLYPVHAFCLTLENFTFCLS